MSNALENDELTVASPAFPYKTQMSSLLRTKMPCKLIWCRCYRHLVGMKILWQPYAFSRFLFAYPTSNWDAKTIAKVLINIMTKHAYLPTTLISDKGTAFMSHVIKEVPASLAIL